MAEGGPTSCFHFVRNKFENKELPISLLKKEKSVIGLLNTSQRKKNYISL